MRIIVAGSRSFDDYELLKRTLDALTSRLTEVVVISGGARGADKLGERWAFERGHTYQVYHPDWDRLGKSAGPARNSEMVANADAAVFFHDGVSKGTADCMSKARLAGLKVKVIHFTPEPA